MADSTVSIAVAGWTPILAYLLTTKQAKTREDRVNTLNRLNRFFKVQINELSSFINKISHLNILLRHKKTGA